MAEEFEGKGDLKAAEEHFVHGGEWESAVEMYKASENWADAHRVAKSEGGDHAHKLVGL